MLPSAGLSLPTTHNSQHRKVSSIQHRKQIRVLISDMIIKYSRTMMAGTRENGNKVFLSRTISLKADFDEKSLVKGFGVHGHFLSFFPPCCSYRTLISIAAVGSPLLTHGDTESR